MLQGVCSNAGKSILTTAICRILLQDGVAVAPYKSQNMSLNSFVTRKGEEMGRAQVVQAQACRLDPDVRMNPVLLKPSSDTGSQIIVMGKPVANMTVEDYVAYKPVAFQKSMDAYDSLASEFDVIVMEGAGSPAEINLKEHDIVNMPMARYAGAHVLLAGDIDRGGVFASFLGTMLTLEDWEEDLVAGFIINRFRGRKSLLAEAISYTEEKTGKPVLGTVDYLEKLGLPEEDSVTFRMGLFERESSKKAELTIALVDLPHISNLNDFEPFIDEPDVRIKTVRKPADLEDAAAIILPGSKNVISDLDWLCRSGLAEVIRIRCQEDRIPVIGICGGFQMLGSRISDPHQVESDRGTVPGLNLLDLTTSLARDKALILREGKHLASGHAVHGYEIHHGRTTGRAKPLILLDGEETGGAASDNNLVWGSYLHGIFDADQFRRWFIDGLRERQGLKAKNRILACYDLEPALDRLAEAVRAQMDMNRIYQLLGL